jgi:hypothetical protein
VVFQEELIARSVGWNGGKPIQEDFEMAEITAALVKELRERTGEGMMDCKSLDQGWRRHRESH